MMKISIITVVLNAVDSIERTLLSVKLQKYEQIEFIVIDGASNDGTLNILAKYRNSIAKLVSEVDDGLYHAMNKGKDLATGDYALFINAGDEFVSSRVIGDLVKEMSRGLGLYYGNTILHYSSIKRKAPHIHHQSILYPREYYERTSYDYTKYKIVSEADYTYRAEKLYPRYYCEVDMVLSKLEGFRIGRFKSIRGTIAIYREVQSLTRRYVDNVGRLYIIMYPFKCMVKYAAYKIGGMSLLSRLVLMSCRRID